MEEKKDEVKNDEVEKEEVENEEVKKDEKKEKKREEKERKIVKKHKKKKVEEKQGNLTLSLGIVKPVAKPAPLAGYDVVVYKKKRGGATFKGILRAGTGSLFARFSTPLSYTCCAVNADPNLEIDFDTEITLREQHQQFTLNSTVSFHVTDPEKIADHIDSDPVKRIRKHMQRQFTNCLSKSKYQIEKVMSNFEEVEAYILESTQKEIRNFASVYGIYIDEINLNRQVPSVHWDVHVKDGELKRDIEKLNIKKKELKKELEEMELSYEKQKKEIELERELQEEKNQLEGKKRDFHRQEEEKDNSLENQDKLFKAAVLGGIDKLVKQVDSPENFLESANALMKTVQKYFNLKEQFSNPHISSGSGGQASSLPSLGAGPFQNTQRLLTEITHEINSGSYEEDEKKEMLSSATHLMAELYREKGANTDVILKYRKQLGEKIISQNESPLLDFMDKIKSLNDQLDKLFPQTKDMESKT